MSVAEKLQAKRRTYYDFDPARLLVLNDAQAAALIVLCEEIERGELDWATYASFEASLEKP